MRVITFSRYFPSNHPRKGDPTYFVEQICRGIHEWTTEGKAICNLDVWAGGKEKHHTIRAGNRWKVGDWFSPRVWSGKPYASKQIQFASDIQIKKIWEFEFINSTYNGEFGHDKGRWFLIDNIVISDYERGLLAKNDGLDEDDFIDWFKCHPKKKETFKGQILCFNESINYLDQ